MVSANDATQDILENENSIENSVPTSNLTDIEIAIQNANDGDTVKLNDSYVSTKDENDYSTINITKSLNIEGVSDLTVIDGKDKGIFDINTVDVKFSNIKFINCGQMPCISIHNSNVTFNNCVFENNRGLMGSSVSANFINSEGTINIINCTFKDNKVDDGAGSVGGALYFAIENSQTTINIINTVFMNNSAYKGGSIYIPSDNKKQSKLNIQNSKFIENNIIEEDIYVPYLGADIQFEIMEDYEALNFEVNIDNSSFKHSPKNVMDSSVESCVLPVKNININNSYFENIILFTDNGVLKINNSEFSNFLINTNYCYDIYYDYYYEDLPNYESNFMIDIDNSKFIDSSLDFDGGNITNSKFNDSDLLKSSNKVLNIYDSEFENDSYILIEEGTANIFSSNFTNDSTAINLYKGKLYLENSVFNKVGIEANYKNVVFNNTKLNNVVTPINFKITSSINYKSGKYISIKLTNANTGALLKKFKVTVELRNSNYKLLKTYKNLVTDSKGFVYLKDLSSRNAGDYNLVFKSTNYYLDKSEGFFTIKKAPTTVKAPKVTNKYKKSKYFKVTVKAYKKPVKSIYVKVKVYTGKKYKTYTIKTDKKGVAKLNTKKLKVGKHKVVITSGNSNYKISAKSTIVIKKR